MSCREFPVLYTYRVFQVLQLDASSERGNVLVVLSLSLGTVCTVSLESGTIWVTSSYSIKKIKVVRFL